jgi:hypothetical protein
VAAEKWDVARRTHRARSRVLPRAAGVVLWLAGFGGCTGGQTTVPTSFNPGTGCDVAVQRVRLEHGLDPRTLEMAWQKTAPGAPSGEGTTHLTIDVEFATAARCPDEIAVRVELSSEDGMLEFSGTGVASSVSNRLHIDLQPAPGLTTGTLEIGNAIRVELEYEDGVRVTAQEAQ